MGTYTYSNLQFVPSIFDSNFYYIRVDYPYLGDGRTNLTPHLYCESWSDVEKFCEEQWPDQRGSRWWINLERYGIWLTSTNDFIILKLAMANS